MIHQTEPQSTDSRNTGTPRRVLIVGGVAGGASCAARLRRLDESVEVVMFDRGPQYALQPVPVQGKFGCVIKQTINGKRIECTGTYASEGDAIRGGLDDLRKALGW